MKKSPSTTNKRKSLALPLSLLTVVIVWQLLCSSGLVPRFMLPSPVDVVEALLKDAALLWHHSRVTLMEAMLGLAIGTAVGFVFAVLMDFWDTAYRACYPLLVLTQTVPPVAIAPLLVLWFGYDMTPKVLLIVIVTFFPITVGTLTGLRSCDRDYLKLLTTMGASWQHKLFYVKLPLALNSFFSGLKISASYAIVGAVISEWLGGFNGLGVYMIRVKKAFAFDRMFAVILIISLLSLLLMGLVECLSKKCQVWRKYEHETEE